MAWREAGNNYPQIDDALHLKICDLCGALNLVSDTECVVCRWHGHFERRPEVARIALGLHRQRKSASDPRCNADGMTGPEDGMYGFRNDWRPSGKASGGGWRHE